MKSVCYGATDVGRCRQNNEDAYLLQPVGDDSHLLAVVVDGLGGHEGGEIAAALAAKCMVDYLEGLSVEELGLDALKQSVIYANNSIVSQQVNPRWYNMGCVLTALLFDFEQAVAYLCHVGDTRCYQFREGALTKLSRDHSLVGIEEDEGRLTEEEAMHHPRRNVITRALGLGRLDWTTDYFWTATIPVEPDAQYLLCSDGLYDMLPTRAIAQVLAEQPTAKQRVETLIRQANEAGGKDNVTVVLVETRP